MKHIVKDSAQSVVVRHEAELQTKQDHFIYKSDGTVVANSPEGERTIDSLNLNCQSLVKLRAKAIYTLVYAEECDLHALSQKIMDRKSDGTLPEFCFVIRSVIENMLKE